VCVDVLRKNSEDQNRYQNGSTSPWLTMSLSFSISAKLASLSMCFLRSLLNRALLNSVSLRTNVPQPAHSPPCFIPVSDMVSIATEMSANEKHIPSRGVQGAWGFLMGATSYVLQC
jgi:hypothetical protein